MLHNLAIEISNWLHTHPEWGGIITFVIAFLESLAIVGIFIPALLFFTAIGALVSSGVLPWLPIVLWAFAGAVLGDGCSYLTGYLQHEKLQNVWPFNKYQNLFAKGKSFFKQHGGKSVFISRFVGPLRAIMPMVAGMLGMKPQRFFLVNIPSAIIWSPFYMSGGFLLGAAATSLSPHSGQHFALILSGALIGVGIIYLLLSWLIRWLHPHLHPLIMRFESLRRVFHNAIDFNHGNQTFLGLWGIVCLILFCCVLLLVMGHFGIDTINLDVYNFFVNDRNPWGDQFFLWLTLLGQDQVLLAWLAFVTLYLFIIKKQRAAKYVFGLTFTASLVIYLLKLITHSPRPGGLVSGPLDFSFPSGHVVLSIIGFGFIALLLINHFEKKFKRWTQFIVAVLIFGIAISRLYLGAHWLTDVVGSTLLGSTLLLFFIIAYRRKAMEPIRLWPTLLVFILSFAVVYASYAWFNYATLLQSYQMVPASNTAVMLPPAIFV